MRSNYRLFCAVILSIGAAGAAQAADKLSATYKFYWNGLLVSEATTQAEISPDAYDFAINLRMRGLAKLFANGHSEVRSSGRWGSGAPVPAIYRSDGRWDGEDYAQTLTFDANGALTERQRDWPEKWLTEFKREPVPQDMQVGPDPASLVLKMIRKPVEAALGEDGVKERSFDGDSVLDWGLRCLPEPAVLEPSKRSPYSGEAYECSFGAMLVAGKRILTEKQKKKAEKRRRKEEKRRKKGKEVEEGKPPKLWVQSFEGGAYVLPVRAEVSTDMGTVRMYLSELSLELMPRETLASASATDTEKVPTVQAADPLQ